MEILENVFLAMFLLGFLFTVLSAVMSGAFGHAFGEGTAFDAHGGDIGHMGGGAAPTAGEGQPEVGWASHDLSSFSPLSPTTISAFFAATGGVGWLALTRWEWNPWGSSILAVGSGIVFAGLLFFGLDWMFRATQGSSMVAMDGLVGVEAEVNIVIPSGGIGEIAFVRNGQRCVMSGRCADAATVPQGARVVVKAVTSTVFIVEETRESWLARSRNQASKAAG